MGDQLWLMLVQGRDYGGEEWFGFVNGGGAVPVTDSRWCKVELGCRNESRW